MNKRPLLYLHIHKCGGSSIRDCMRSYISTGDLSTKDIYLRDEDKKIPFDENGRVYFEAEKSLQAKFTAAHIHYYEVPNPERWHWITGLRNPIDRVISDYNYKIWQAQSGNPYFQNMQHLTWDDYLNHIGQGQANNHICRMLVGPDWPKDTNPDRALEMLNNFGAIGILESEKFGNPFIIKHICTHLEIPIQTPPITNINHYATREVPESIRTRIEESNTGDIKLYQSVKSLLVP